jgi:hypothetical protein
MKLLFSATAIGVLLLSSATTTQAQPAGPAFPGNEAVRIVDGKRVVEAPPLTPTAQRYVDGGGKFPPPSAAGEVFMIETADALVECSSPYISKTACLASTLGKTKRPRFWTVKLNNVWLHCESRGTPRKCEPAAAGVPGGMGTVE